MHLISLLDNEIYTDVCSMKPTEFCVVCAIYGWDVKVNHQR
jgi:hypothetical protein